MTYVVFPIWFSENTAYSSIPALMVGCLAGWLFCSFRWDLSMLHRLGIDYFPILTSWVLRELVFHYGWLNIFVKKTGNYRCMKIIVSYCILFLGNVLLFVEQYPGIDYCSISVHLKSVTIRKSLLLFPIVQGYFGYTGLLWFSGGYSRGCPFCKECHRYYEIFCIVFANLHE